MKSSSRLQWGQCALNPARPEPSPSLFSMTPWWPSCQGEHGYIARRVSSTRPCGG
jgi:hypothetical protein